MEYVDFTTNFPFGNPLLFLAFLAQVITETISTKDRNQPVDIFKILNNAAGGRIGLPVDAEQPKTLASWWLFTLSSAIASLSMKNCRSLNITFNIYP